MTCCTKPPATSPADVKALSQPVGETLPVLVIGAGPVGLAALAHLVSAGLPAQLLERGEGPGAAVMTWSHVRLFSPWRYNVDRVAQGMLDATGWRMPNADALPTGGELLRDYLVPLARLPALAPSIRYAAEVVAVSREHASKITSAAREQAPFVVLWRDAGGRLQRTRARALIDASGTWSQPNPAGSDGLAVDGEAACADRIAYGIPDVLGTARRDYAGRHTLVIGAGHSAINVALDLLRLQETEPGTRLSWAIRGNDPERLLGGGLADALPGRGELGLRTTDALRAGLVDLHTAFRVVSFGQRGERIAVQAHEAQQAVELLVDRVVVATGCRPDLTLLSELRIALDPVVEAPQVLAPMIDPNLHSCGTVPPHGVDELAHPDAGVYIVGMKSYGRAPTFLMATGYEQVRSIVAELAGDPVAAREVHLSLPETGVCGGTLEPASSAVASGCCGGPAPTLAEACCAADETVRLAGTGGCGCR